MLKVENINVYYGAIHALKGISVEVKQGEIVTLIGANGAGKSTILRTISGLLRAKTGDIVFEGNAIGGMAAEEIVRKGISQVPEGRRIFANMTVAENLELGAYIRSDKAGIRKDIDKVFERFPRLGERRSQIAGTLSGGEQQMLAIGRGLMSQPKLMLLDEPSMGLAPLLVKEIFSIIQEINASGTTILLITHDMHLMLEYTPHALVLHAGEILHDGTAVRALTSDEIATKASLKVTSLYELATRAGIENCEAFVQHFIDYERSNAR